MNGKKLITKKQEGILSKSSINLPPEQRLELLLKVEEYPIVDKITSAPKQIREMIDLYNYCCLMLAMYLPNANAEKNFFQLSCIASVEKSQEIITGKFAEYFKLLACYENIEKKIMAIQMLFYQYKHLYPELYDKYNLEDIANEKITDAIQSTRELICEKPQLIEDRLKRWGIYS